MNCATLPSADVVVPLSVASARGGSIVSPVFVFPGTAPEQRLRGRAPLGKPVNLLLQGTPEIAMNYFSDRSRRQLDTCHPDLIELFERVLAGFDCTIIEGYRGEEAQEEYFRTGRSQLHYPESLHNATRSCGADSDEDHRIPESLAADAAPYPIDWDGVARFMVFGGYVIGVASEMDLKIRWGGDWDGDWELHDQSFHDLPHFELIL